MATGYSPKLPLSSLTNHYDMITLFETNTRQNLKNLLLTSPGERVMLPDFGVGLRRFLFETEYDFVADEIKDRIYEQVRFYMNYIKIITIDCSFEPRENGDRENHQLNVTVSYEIPFLNVKENLVVTA